MSVGLSTLSQMQVAFFEGLSQFTSQFALLLDGDGSDAMKEVEGGGRIRYIFHSGRGAGRGGVEVFREKMEELEYVSEVPEEGGCRGAR